MWLSEELRLSEPALSMWNLKLTTFSLPVVRPNTITVPHCFVLILGVTIVIFEVHENVKHLDNLPDELLSSFTPPGWGTRVPESWCLMPRGRDIRLSVLDDGS